MKFRIELFVREHRNGFFTLRVAGSPPLVVYTDKLEDARQDLALVLGDRIERTHPRLQAELGSLGAERIETLEVEDALPVFGERGAVRAPMRFSALLSERRSFQSLWFPRPELHHWIRKGGDWKEAGTEVLAARLERLAAAELLDLRYERREWIEELIVDAEPPPLSAFTGKNRDVELLPPRVAVPEKPDEDEDPDPEASLERKGKKQKRPETPTLRQIGTNLGELAKDEELEHAHERGGAIADLMRILESPGEKALAVVGPAGVGKTALLNELVYRLRAPGVPKRLRGRPVWFADASRLIAGEGYFGDWQRQCLDVIAECEAAEVIWYIGPLLPLLDAGKSINSDHNVALLLAPYLAAKRLTIIGESTEKDFAKLELRNASFARAFTPYRVTEPSPKEARQILAKVATELSDREGIDVDTGGLDAIFELTKRYVSEGSHLGAAIHFLRRTVETMSAKKEVSLDRRRAVTAFSAETGLPEGLIRDDLPLDPGAVAAAFRTRLIGQDLAVRRMTDLVAVIKAGLSDLSRPLGSFLFVGPTGVGKTETAKALASYLFGGDHRLARFDMSEFLGGDAVHRFLGDAQSEGKLVEVIRKRPFSVVLLDEIEKAHPAIFDVLLQVLGEARLTDESGRVADFRNAVIIMTSNLGVETFRRRAGFSLETDLSEHFVREAEKFFRPELFNRIDHIVPFAPLEADAIAEITRRELDKLAAREGLRQRDLSLAFPPELFGWLAERGVDPRYGARPLKRLLERKLSIPLARRISRAREEERPILEVRPDGEELAFEPAGESSRAKAATLGDLLARIDDVIFRVQRWKSTPEWRDLVQELRVLDQLAQSRLFWVNRELAEARMAGFEGGRALIADWEALDGRVSGLQDLAYDAHYARDGTQAAMFEEELAKIVPALAELELRLYARRFPEPDRCVLYLEPARGAMALGRMLQEAYVNLAWESGWRLGIHHGVKLRAEAAPEPAIRVGKKKKEEAASVRVRWNEEREIDPRERHSADRDEDDARKRMMRELPRVPEETTVALVFDGPHVSALLSAESGVHQLVDGNENTQVKVAFISAGGGLMHPLDIGFSSARCRTLHENKRQVLDHVLGIHAQQEPRLHRIYRRFMRGRMYREVFGAPGLVWFGRWEEG